ncbi:FxSxx-COOH system tetratricopeptide repeat protein [Micromonospora rifamycinica]|uniref:FxSxx-COOH system tetratricopeptide repeat protein n=1 Tax=Micromonospora rifamycinica TaxID=291594 RepID=UPI00342ED4CB
MSAVEVITVALAAGVKDTTSTAVRDAYAGLKGLLKRRFGDADAAAVQALDADETEPGTWQARIGDALTECGVVDDEQILTAARRLLALADPEKAKTFRINVGNSHGAVGEFNAPVTFNQGPPVPPSSTGSPLGQTAAGDTTSQSALTIGAAYGPVGVFYAPVTMHTRSPVTWPVLVGRPPALASAFQPRHGVRKQVLAARGHGADVILTQHTERRDSWGTQVLAGGGGVGKSQLAAWFAGQAVQERTADLVVWVNANSPDQIITGYARAAMKAGVPGADGADMAADAAALLEWLHTTERSWLVVLDDIIDPADVADWWPPHRRAGWTLATTRLQDATLISSGRQQIDVDVYTPDEALTYLTDRLTGARHGHLLDDQAADLATAVGHLPLALSHAAAYMINQQEGCTAYLARYTAGDERLAELMPGGADPDAYGRPVAVTLLLALDAADTTEPAGLARAALAVAAVCDPAGHPDTLWATTPVTDYLAAHRADGPNTPVTAGQARKTLRLLHRYGLLTHTPADGARAVRIHALTARATRETTDNPAAAAHTTADALLALWPNSDSANNDLIAALRENTIILADIAGDLLWQSDGHPLLYRTGASLFHAGLHTSAVTYWQRLAAQADRMLGKEHLNTLTARANLAASYWQAGRTGEAIAVEEQLVADFERLLGNEHPTTLTARANLAASYWQAGRSDETLAIYEQVVPDCERLLGKDHPITTGARSGLATSYRQAGRTGEAIAIEEQLVADSERLLGKDHPNTLAAQRGLAASYQHAGRTDEAIALQEQAITDYERLLGKDHPNTLAAWSGLATSYRQAGRTGEAIAIEEQLVADSERLLGKDHPNTVAARRGLATSYQHARRPGKAIPFQEQVVVDFTRMFGANDLRTQAVQADLAVLHWQAGLTADAITLLERVVVDRVRLLGDEHPDTVAVAGMLRRWRAES